VLKRKRFILVIMDNSTTAMTGMQPTPQTGVTAAGLTTHSMTIEGIIESFGIDFMKILDPYDVPHMIEVVKEAYSYLENGGKAPAVIIARRACLLASKRKPESEFDRTSFESDCIGCGTCTDLFDCPGLIFDEETQRIKVDDGVCTGCGTCLYVCPLQKGT
jgi:indolepyruvate ferredoxin oxidoreductase alpha subunit